MTMIAENREVLREIWEGKIPVCFSIIPDEIFTVEKPDLYYVNISSLPFYDFYLLSIY